MKQNLTFFLLLVLSTPSFSQSFSQVSSGAINEGIIFNTLDVNDKPVDGTPFYSEDWQKGIVSTIKGKTIELESMQYNIYLGKLVFLKDEVAYTLHQDLLITKFELGPDTFVYTSYGDGNSRDFFQVIQEGSKGTLLKRFQCSFDKGKASNGMIPATNDKYKIRSNYYIKFNDKNALKLKMKKESVLAVMQDQSSEIETYMKKNKIKLKKEDDLVKIFEFYNTLN